MRVVYRASLLRAQWLGLNVLFVSANKYSHRIWLRKDLSDPKSRQTLIGNQKRSQAPHIQIKLTCQNAYQA